LIVDTQNVVNMERGLIHIYTGEGKGKTSAGMGLLVRALGRGLSVKIIQLFKRNTGEQYFFENSGFNYFQFKPLHPFFKTYNKDELESLRKEFLEFWNEVTNDLNFDVILIDEIGPGIAWGVIDEDLVFDLIKRKPQSAELVLTGRDFPLSIIEKADYISEINKIKHPYDKGVLARKGIEF